MSKCRSDQTVQMSELIDIARRAVSNKYHITNHTSSMSHREKELLGMVYVEREYRMSPHIASQAHRDIFLSYQDDFILI